VPLVVERRTLEVGRCGAFLEFPYFLINRNEPSWGHFESSETDNVKRNRTANRKHTKKRCSSGGKARQAALVALWPLTVKVVSRDPTTIVRMENLSPKFSQQPRKCAPPTRACPCRRQIRMFLARSSCMQVTLSGNACWRVC
jgi:hypothetical protein